MSIQTISLCEDCERRILLLAPHIMAGVFPSNRNGQWVHLDEHGVPDANIDTLDHDAVPADEGHEEEVGALGSREFAVTLDTNIREALLRGEAPQYSVYGTQARPAYPPTGWDRFDVMVEIPIRLS